MKRAPVDFRSAEEMDFADLATTEADGLVTTGGPLTPDRLLTAYSLGIFANTERAHTLWLSPDPRFVIEPARRHVGHSLERVVRAGRYRVTSDTAFAQVIRGCAQRARPGPKRAWLTEEMIAAFVRLHDSGLAHSVEAWQGAELVGGVYGLSLGRVFFGESAYADRPDASKVALVHLLEALEIWDFDLFDCQVTSPLTARFGAGPIPRAAFLERLTKGLSEGTLVGPWTLPDPRHLRPRD